MGECVLVHGADVLAGQVVTARGRHVQTAQNVHQSRLARARGPHDGNVFAAAYFHRDTVQRLDLHRPGGVHLADIHQTQDRRGGFIGKGQGAHPLAPPAPGGGPLKPPPPKPPPPVPLPVRDRVPPVPPTRKAAPTTLSPAFSPLRIWVTGPYVVPTFTGVLTCAPLLIWCTTVLPPSVCSALVGTVSRLSICLTMMETSAAPPAYKPLGLPVTTMVTGKLALPLDDDEAMMPMDLTVPNILVALPVGVISACRPFLSLGRSALPTLACTTLEVVEITTIWAVEEDEEDPALEEDEEALPEPVPVEAPPAEAAFPTLSPIAMLTCATVPAIGEVSDAAVRAVFASVSLPWASTSCAWAEAICTADDMEPC